MPTSALPRGKNITISQKDQSAFGTLATGNWTLTNIYSHSLEIKEPFDDDPLLGRGRNNNRDSEVPGPGLSEVAGSIIAPIDYNHIGIWLKGAFGAASVSGAGDPYTHTFTSGGEVLPHKSIEVTHTSAIFFDFESLLVNKLSFDIGRAAGYDRVTVEMMGRAVTKNTSTQAGTPSSIWATAQAPKSLPIFKKGGTQIAYVTGLKATYDNKASNLDYVGSKYPGGHALDEPATFTGTIDLRFVDATLYDIAIANAAAFTGELLWSTSSDRSLSILANAMRFEPAGIKVDGPGGIKQSFNFRCEQASGAAMLTTTLKSSVSAY